MMKLRTDRQEKRRKEAAQRQSRRGHRTKTQQLAVLDAKLGKNIGAQKERARLKKNKNGGRE